MDPMTFLVVLLFGFTVGNSHGNAECKMQCKSEVTQTQQEKK